MTTNTEKLEAVILANDSVLLEIYSLQKEIEIKKSLIFNAIGDVSETFDSETDEDEVSDILSDISSNLDVVWSGHHMSYTDWTPGERVEFWVPSTC